MGANEQFAQTSADESDTPTAPIAAASESVTLWLLIAILAWVQFPLGSNRIWSWSVLPLMVAVAWCAWMPAGLSALETTATTMRRLALPGLLFLIVLAWAWLQTADFMPAAWHNPIWHLVDGKFGHPVAGAISVNPFATQTEVMKLGTYLAIGFLATALSLNHRNARSLFIATVIIGTSYAVYGVILSALHTSQITLMEGVLPPYGRAVTGGFVNKNSFATFTGLSLLGSLALLVEAGNHSVITVRGWRTHLRTLVQFASAGKGALWLTSSFILFAALIASNSRAGLIATLVGLFVIFAITIAITARKGQTKWTFLGGACALVAIVALFLINGTDLQAHFGDLLGTQGITDFRPVMWGAAWRSIEANPYLGTGLGTYFDVQPLYATEFVPYVIDRVHNDYLEMALGLGIPMACLWGLAMVMLMWTCVRGALRRHRRRIYALTAAGAMALVGFHSLFDFSLQMPAVSTLLAVILGVGIGQSQRTT